MDLPEPWSHRLLAATNCRAAVSAVAGIVFHHPSQRRMKRAFKYDVAITAAEFDTLTVEELQRRLEHRLSKPVYVAPRVTEKPRTPAVTATVKKTIEKDARVVVVLFQRLWGVSANSAAEV